MTLQLPREYWKRGRLLKMIEELEARIEYLEDKLMDASVDAHAQIDKREATIAQQKTELDWYEDAACKKDASLVALLEDNERMAAELATKDELLKTWIEVSHKLFNTLEGIEDDAADVTPEPSLFV